MTTPDLDAVVLPPLPEWMLDDGITTLADFELRDHMGSYATAAVLADRERRAGEPDGWKWRFIASKDQAWRLCEKMPSFDSDIVEAVQLFSAPVVAEPSDNKRDAELRDLLAQAEHLLHIAWGAMLKMGLRDLGSDGSLSHEVRMFALAFSHEGRDGPGALQIRGTGEHERWQEKVCAALNPPSTGAAP